MRQNLGKLVLEKVYFLFSTCRIVYHFKTGTLQTGVEAPAVMEVGLRRPPGRQTLRRPRNKVRETTL